MKIAISASGKTLESQLDQRFGRTAYFILINTDTMDFEAIDNGGAVSSGGAGITAAQSVVDKGAEAVITGNVGPNAMSVLQAAKMEIYRGSPASVKDNIEQFMKGMLAKIDTTVPSHFGMWIPGSGK